MSERTQSVDGHHGSLQQRLSTLSTLAMAFAILNTWIALAGSIGLILPSGGSAAFLYGFLFCVACSFCVAASLGELAAIWPTAGGQYHYVFALCTEKWRKPVSFIVGWTNIAGWLIVVTVQGYFAAQFISAAIVVASDDSFQITPARTYGIFLAVLTSTTAINIWGNSLLGKWNTGALYWSIAGVIITSVVLLAKSAKTDAEYVFTNFNNETNWPDGIAWILGLLQSALSLTAFDVVLHMTEEMPNPRRDAPRALLYAIAVGGVTGLLFTLVILFCLADPASILTAPGNMPIVAMVLQATKSRAAAAIISLMLSVCFINGSSASITSASRLLFAMARDRGIIFHDFFGHIAPRLNVPLRTILLCYVFNVSFGLLYLGPTVAFSAYVASLVILLNLSYAAPTIITLMRGRSILKQHQTTKGFQLGSAIGTIVNCVSVLFLIVTSIFFCFPVALPVSSDNMNYVCVVLGIFAVLVSLFWLQCRNKFLGPKLDMIASHDRDTESLQLEKASSSRPMVETFEDRD
ncbi:hypothetical protein NLG97_g10378 [Lecanicillium saksenae]|uniref:Uncharacterized protein n=1 Tax=Lecanicillium saksenae TaxID=468837 RepID=A0ACC1QF14_9HYPO|nr:hypothetical protein NLG97_g10378 [Lecanicillium saksenae]